MIDNTHVVVLHGTGREMVPVPEMAAFSERFGFQFVAHAIGDANRSARVERPVWFIENVIACAVSVFGSNPSDLPGEVEAVGLRKLAALKINDKLFPGSAKRTVTVVAFHGIKFSHEPPERFGDWFIG